MLRWWTSQMTLATAHNGTAQAAAPHSGAAQAAAPHNGAVPAGTALASVTIVPAGLNLDTVHNMVRKVMPVNARNAMQNITRTVNGVHPAISGQGQIADSMWAWIKYQTATKAPADV